jgi:CubicO group peptidase (beta-lactamase class C family)
MKITIPLAICSLLSGCAVDGEPAVSDVKSLEVSLPGDIPTPQLDVRHVVDRAVGEPVAGTKRRYVGLSVLVIKDGSKYTFNYGQAVHRSGGGPPVTSDTLFAIGSVTKMFTGTLLARMQSEGSGQPAK